MYKNYMIDTLILCFNNHFRVILGSHFPPIFPTWFYRETVGNK